MIFLYHLSRGLYLKWNSTGVFKGRSLLEIKQITDELYKIDFPISVIKRILEAICKEINTESTTHLTLYNDGSFSIKQYSFTEYEDIIANQTKEVNELEKAFKQFCKSSELRIENGDSIFSFIEQNKFTLSKYIANCQEKNDKNYTAEAEFIEFFKRIPPIYEEIKNIYLGSILASYIEYTPSDITKKVELVFDTNFLLGLLDLNTPESTYTCKTLINIAKQQGFKLSVLKATIEEAENLLQTKAKYFDKSFLPKKVNPEDVYNACDRRNLSRSDLERITDNLEESIGEFGISIIYADRLKKEAKFTEEYRHFKDIRQSERSALHDAAALLYINKQRKSRIKEFDRVNAWFVNNSVSTNNSFLKNGFQPEIIKVDDLLNILWLSNPQINKSIGGDDLAEMGLTSAISLTLNKNLPKAAILRELGDNIHKYAEGNISDTDVLRISTRITNRQLEDVEELNSLAKQDPTRFVKRLGEEAIKEEKREERREHVFETVLRSFKKAKNEYEEKSKDIDSVVNDNDLEITKLKSKVLTEQNKNREIQRDKWYNDKLKKWRRKSWIEFFICVFILVIGILYTYYQCNWDTTKMIESFRGSDYKIIIGPFISFSSTIFSVIVLNTLVGKYRNHSNIESYKNGLKIPEEYKELKKPVAN